MRKLILFTAFLSLSIFGSYAQTIKDDPEYLKGIHNVWKAGFSFQEITNAEDRKSNKAELLPLIVSSYENAQSYYDKLEKEYSENKSLEQLKLHLSLIKKSIESLNSEEWGKRPHVAIYISNLIRLTRDRP